MRQFSKTQRRLAVGAFLITAGPVALGSVAYACQSLATLHANPRTVAAGGSVTVNGANYSSAASSTPVQIRLDSRSGPILREFPAGVRTINGDVTIPAGTAIGTHTLIATQFTSSGNAVSGTPGRASVQVTVGARTAEGSTAAGPVAATTNDPAATVTESPAAATPSAPTAAPTAAPVARDAAAPAATPSAAPAAQAATAAPAVATPSAPAAASAAPAVAAPEVASPSAPAASSVDVGGLLPAASDSSTSALPGLTLAVGLALVLLSLGAFVKSGRNMFGRGFSPLAG